MYTALTLADLFLNELINKSDFKVMVFKGFGYLKTLPNYLLYKIT